LPIVFTYPRHEIWEDKQPFHYLRKHKGGGDIET